MVRCKMVEMMHFMCIIPQFKKGYFKDHEVKGEECQVVVIKQVRSGEPAGEGICFILHKGLKEGLGG